MGYFPEYGTPSPILKKTRRMCVYTPPGYENGNEKYPVLYLFHGAGGNEDSWTYWRTAYDFYFFD